MSMQCDGAAELASNISYQCLSVDFYTFKMIGHTGDNKSFTIVHMNDTFIDIVGILTLSIN